MNTSQQEKIDAIHRACIQANLNGFQFGVPRPIRLSDVLLAIKSKVPALDGMADEYATLDCVKMWNLALDDLTLQSEPTINFLYELIKSSPNIMETTNIRKELTLYLPSGMKDFEWEALERAVQHLIDRGVAAEKEDKITQYEEIFSWLLGENGNFPDLSQKPHYSFRSELRKRLSTNSTNQ